MLVAAVFCLAAAGDGQGAPPTGPALLRRMLLNRDRIRFEAIQTTTPYAGGKPLVTTVTREVHFEAGRSRLEYRSPRMAAGRLVVDDGKRHWEFDPRRNAAASMPGSWRPIGTQDADRLLARVLRSYTVKVIAGPVVSGRPTWCAEISPKSKDRNRQVWCADRKTGLVLKREVYDAAGRLKSVSVYSDVNYRPSAGPEVTSFQPPRGARVYNRGDRPPAVSTLAEARRLAAGFGPVPAALADGFEFESARIVSVRGAPSLHLEYSDGLIGVSLIRLRGAARVRPNSPAARRVDVRGCQGTLSQGARYAVLSWSPGHATYSLVAELSEPTLLDIARNIPTN